MSRVFIGLGSNTEPKCHLMMALDKIANGLTDLEISPAYRSDDITGSKGDFINLVAAGNTDLDPEAFVAWLKTIERDCGRNAECVTVDLDLLLYDERIIDQGKLQIPRRDVTRYAHVLKPLSDLAPQARHPVTGLSYRQMWQAFNDRDQVISRLADNFLKDAT